ncbi:MAG: putative metal-binding motif-containing protein [Deltaproteobacteria bacterium]|nr:putative metal-binding motif-containing protein [Deltaproteobacteria bacterium]
MFGMIWLLTLACFNDYNSGVDPDGDGAPWPDDCDETDASVHPGGIELCNERDDACDGEVDEGVTTTYYADADADGGTRAPGGLRGGERRRIERRGL